MIQFPETARVEWQAIASALNAKHEVQRRIERGTAVERAVEKLRVNHEAKLIHQQELDADTTPALEMATLANYTIGSVSDMIEGVMKENGLTIMLGPSGSGKSTLALQMLHSLMSGDDWLGQPVTQINGAVGILSYDMDAGLLLDWMSNFPNIDPNKVSVVNAHRRGNPLGVPAMRAQIAAVWQKEKVETILVDSFSASFFAHDQNDAATTMAHYRDLQLFATECGAKAVIVITHSTDNNPLKARGSTVHHDVADSIISLALNAKGERIVRMVKYRAALTQKAMDPVIVTAPDGVTHLVDLDYGAMQMEGMHLPASAAAHAFDTPAPHEAPETGEYEGDDDL